MSRRQRVGRICQDFSENTSFHGIPWIGIQTERKWKVFWILVFVFCVCMFLSQLYLMIDRFLRYDKIVEVQIKFETIPFPAVTFCNTNPYKKSAIAKKVPKIDNMFKEYKKAAAETIPKIPEFRYRTSHETCQCSKERNYNRNYKCDHVPKNEVSARSMQPLSNKTRLADCTCFLDNSTKVFWPCYHNADEPWHERRCQECTPSGICQTRQLNGLFQSIRAQINRRSLPEDFILAQNDGKSSTSIEPSKNTTDFPCFCQEISGICVLKPDLSVRMDALSSNGTTPTPAAASTQQKESNAIEEDALGFEGATDKAALQSKATNKLISMIGELDRDAQAELSYTVAEQIHVCSFSADPCNLNKGGDFVSHLDPKFGNCYIFNGDPDRPKRAAMPGSLYGLRFLVFSNSSEYLPTTESSGVKLTIHDQKDYPFPDTFGYTAPTGFMTSLSVRMQKMISLPHPYGDCREDYIVADAEKEHYLYGNKYTLEGCERSCIQHRLCDLCGCADPRYPIPKGSRVCNSSDPVATSCLLRRTKETALESEKFCKCKQLCERNAFTISFSTGQWPVESARETLCAGTNNPNCIEMYQKQGVFIEVYYEQMNYQMLKEHEAYGFVNLLADFGGQISLWLGFSVITGVEVFVLMGQLVRALFFSSKHKYSRDAESNAMPKAVLLHLQNIHNGVHELSPKDLEPQGFAPAPPEIIIEVEPEPEPEEERDVVSELPTRKLSLPQDCQFIVDSDGYIRRKPSDYNLG